MAAIFSDFVGLFLLACSILLRIIESYRTNFCISRQKFEFAQLSCFFKFCFCLEFGEKAEGQKCVQVE